MNMTQNSASEIRPDVSIIVVSWNTVDLLRACLRSVFKEPAAPRPVDGLAAQVIVVDNASHDGSADMVRAEFPQVELVANQDNIGFARANNQAMPLVRGRQVLLLNPDTTIYPNAVRTLVDFMDRNPKAGAVGSRLLNPDGSLQVYCYRAPTLFRELWRLLHLDRLRPLGIYDMRGWDTTRPREVDVVQGASMMLRKSVLDTMPLFDEDYFIYSEEVDLCRRLRGRGLGVFWVPDSRVVHYGGESTRQVAAAMFLRLYQGKILYFRKHSGPNEARLYKLILFIASALRLALSPIALLRRSPTSNAQRTLAGHYWRLIRALPSL